MRRFHVVAFSVLLLLPLLASAQSQFDGTWKVNMNSVQLSKKPKVYLLQNGIYEENGFVRIKADDTDQNVSDWDIDTMRIKVIDDYNVEVTTKRRYWNGWLRVFGTAKESISADGNTLDVSWTHRSFGTGHLSEHDTYKRVAKGPAGAHLLSGSWRIEKSEASPDYLTWTCKVNGSELTMRSSRQD